MEADIIKEVLPYIGGFGGAVVLLAILFKDGINVWLRKDSTMHVTLKAHEKTLESHNERLNAVEKNVAVLPAIQEEVGHIRTTLDAILTRLIKQ